MQTVPAAATTAAPAADPPKPSPNFGIVVLAYGLIIVAVAVGHLIDTGSDDFGARVKSDFSLFAVFFIFAQALERLLEPFARLWSGPAAGMTEEQLGKLRANKEVVFWAVATGLAALVCGFMGLRLLESVLELPTGRTGGLRLVDLAVTAAAIGGGTKPLHELIDRLQRPKQPTAPTASAG